MARKSRTRYVTRYVKSGYSRRRKSGMFGKGSLNNLLWGGIAGAISGFIPSNLPVVGKWGKPVILGAGGIIMHKPQLVTCAGYELGRSLIGGNGNGYIANSIFEG